MQVSTQTSRSVVVVARARVKSQQNEVRSGSTPIHAAVLGSITRATPSGISRTPTHRFTLPSRRRQDDEEEEEEFEVQRAAASTSSTTTLRREGGGRPRSLSRRKQLLVPDQVVKAPPSLKMDKGESGRLVVIRSFCRFKPPVVERCRKSGALYFYDVEAAKCLPFNGGHCSRSRNRFVSEEACLEACVVEGLAPE
jgi:hypothetical protein